MRRVLLFLILAITFSGATAFPLDKAAEALGSNPFFLRGKSISQFLNGVTEDMQKDELLELAVDKYANLRVIVLDQELAVDGIAESEILWRDHRVSDSEYAYYSGYTATFIQSIGFYMAPGLVEKLPGRPLAEHDLMVIKKEIPRHGLLHELLHLSIQNEQTLRGDDHSHLPEELVSLISSSAEEVFVDQLLLKHADHFNFSEEEICWRHGYMVQNMSVFESRLKPFYRNENPEIAEAVSSLYKLYSEANRLKHKYHMQCFLRKIIK